MSDTQATIRITADASGVEPGVASAKNALEELGAFVKGTAKSLGPLLGKYGEAAAAAGRRGDAPVSAGSG
jgi:hypothetical protein